MHTVSEVWRIPLRASSVKIKHVGLTPRRSPFYNSASIGVP
jgi:hypothetical protein